MDLLTFSKLADDFFSYLAHQVNAKNQTIESYKRDLAQFLVVWDKALINNPQKNKESNGFLTSYERWLFSKKFSRATIARKCSCLATFTRFINSRGHSDTFLIQRPFLEKKKPIALGAHKIVQLLDSFSADQLPTQYPYRDSAIIELIYATGISSSELADIIINDIDIDNKTILIHGFKKRVVLFGSQAAEKIKNYIMYERGEYEQSDPLFVNYKNERLHMRSVQRICKMFGKLIGDSSLTPTVLRASCAVHMLEEGASIDFVKDLLGYRTNLSVEKYKRKGICTSQQKK